MASLERAQRGLHKVEDPVEFLSSLGGLHDVRITGINLDRGKSSLTLIVADLHANFAGLPDDRGRLPCALLFSGVGAASVIVDFAEGVVISEANVRADDRHFHFEAALTSGPKGIVIAFDRLDMSVE
jgi:hypothetical protein